MTESQRPRERTSFEVVIEASVNDRIKCAVAERDEVCKERELVKPTGKLQHLTSKIDANGIQYTAPPISSMLQFNFAVQRIFVVVSKKNRTRSKANPDGRNHSWPATIKLSSGDNDFRSFHWQTPEMAELLHVANLITNSELETPIFYSRLIVTVALSRLVSEMDTDEQTTSISFLSGAITYKIQLAIRGRQ